LAGPGARAAGQVDDPNRDRHGAAPPTESFPPTHPLPNGRGTDLKERTLITQESTFDNDRQTDPRPIGIICPAHERAVRALTAVREKRLADADQHIAAVPEASMRDRAWKRILQALVAIEQVKPSDAEPLLLQAASLCWIDGFGREGTPGPEEPHLHAGHVGARNPSHDAGASIPSRTFPDALRQASFALHHLGRVYRRQERPADASRAHLAAYHLREQYGSYEELWETATELGLDHDVARRFDEGRRWHGIALQAACKTSEEPTRKQAIAWTNICTSCMESGLCDNALSAARSARECWREHDVSDVTAAQADLTLGTALLRHGEALHERGDQLARDVLAEALEWLAAARAALLAFGPEHASEARLCVEQEDFAKRLVASL
jgi:hypothetical protein